MAAPKMHFRTGAAWKGVNKLHVRVNGTWKEVLFGYVRIGGAWKKFHASSPVALPASFNITNWEFGVDSYAGIQFNSNGLLYKVQGDTLSWSSFDTWKNTGAAGDYQVWVERLTSPANSGDTLTGSAENSWLTLSTTRSFYFGIVGAGTKYSYLRIKIRYSAAPNTELIDTGTGTNYYLEAAAEL